MMSNRVCSCAELAEALLDAPDVVLIGHVSPDGDSLGSCLALKWALEGLGKLVQVLNQDPVPGLYRLLPGWEQVSRGAEWLGRPSLVLTVDVADRLRMGDCAPVFDRGQVRAVLDHHASNPGFGQINWIEETAAASGIMVYALIRALGVGLTREMAQCLFVAVSTDTGHFSHSNTDAQALRIAADCIATGIDVADLTQRIYKARSLARTRLLARALVSLEMREQDQLALMCLTQEDFRETGALPEDTEAIVDYGIAVEGTKAAALLVEHHGCTKISLRGRAPMDVGKIATALGGGGHVLAAGCTLNLPLDLAKDKILEALGLFWKG